MPSDVPLSDTQAGSSVLMVFCTFPDEETARRIGTALVEERLAACVNLNPGITSIYQWEGKLETSTEVLAIFKTTREGYPELEKQLQALHPYDVPEILAVPVERGAESYLRWVGERVEG